MHPATQAESDNHTRARVLWRPNNDRFRSSSVTGADAESVDDGAPRTLPAGILRRLAALVYDGLLLFSVIFVATAATLVFTNGEAVGPGNLWLRVYLMTVAFLFFGWFWTHGGQTLGMRAWRLRAERLDGDNMGWTDALRRYLCGLGLFLPLFAGLILQPGEAARSVVVGLGLLPPIVAFLWIRRSPEGLAWHDRASRTRVIHLAKRRRAATPTAR